VRRDRVVAEGRRIPRNPERSLRQDDPRWDRLFSNPSAQSFQVLATRLCAVFLSRDGPHPGCPGTRRSGHASRRHATGCFLIGALMVIITELTQPLRQLLGVGVVGGHTTFSTHTSDVAQLLGAD
jgi:hypothetical protein